MKRTAPVSRYPGWLILLVAIFVGAGTVGLLGRMMPAATATASSSHILTPSPTPATQSLSRLGMTRLTLAGTTVAVLPARSALPLVYINTPPTATPAPSSEQAINRANVYRDLLG